MAQLYAEWTGDVNIPVSIYISKLEGIHDKRIEGQSLRRLKTSVDILKALNAPFTNMTTPMEGPTPEMQNFISDYMSVLAANQQDLKTTEQTALNHLLQNMHTVLNSKEFENNHFKFYFEKLVPYVKECHTDWTPLPPFDTDTNLANQLWKQLQYSQQIRKTFGKYSIPFDIFHVLAGCYACCTDIGVVANWALDLIVRICNGKYFWKEFQECPFVSQYRAIITKYFSFRRNTHRNMEFYYLVKSIQRGDGIECLSENFLKYGQLEAFFKEKLQAIPDMKEMASSQLFPATLFESPADQMAFTIALAHIVSNFDKNTCQPRKGTFAKARKLSTVVKTLMKSASDFDSQYPLPWTMETLKLFMMSDSKIEQSLQMLAEIVFTPDEDEMET